MSFALLVGWVNCFSLGCTHHEVCTVAEEVNEAGTGACCSCHQRCGGLLPNLGVDDIKQR